MSRISIRIGRLDMNRLGFTRRLKCRICGRLLGAQQITQICIFLVFLHFDCCHLCIGDFLALLEALFCFLSIASDSDHSSRTRHFQFEVHVTRSSHETCIGRPTQNDMISTLEIHYFKCQQTYDRSHIVSCVCWKEFLCDT